MRKYLAVNVVAFLVLSFVLWNQKAQTQDQSLRLVLVISIDQMRYDYLPRFSSLYKGGFARLLQEGAVFSEAYYRHASTETGPGHAVILTGRHGSHSGIVANGWYDSYLKTDVNVVDDPLNSPVDGKGRGASPANLIGFTVGDSLKRTSAGSKVVSVSLKDRAAVLLGGKLADAVYWYDPATGHFVTSTYYAKQMPGWLQKFNEKPYPDSFAGGKWERLRNDPQMYEKYAGRDNVEGEWDRKDTVFPHLVRGKPPEPDFYNEFRRLPFADDMTLQVALQAFQQNKLGLGANVDVFAVSFSATDIIGHTYGPDSQEILDQLLRLDLTLEKLFAEVESSVGLNKTLVVLTADHGVMPLVEVLKEKGIDARRVQPQVIEDAVRKALAERYPGADDLIASFYTPSVYLNEASVAKRKISLAEVEETVKKALLSTGMIEAVYTTADFAAGPRPNDPVFDLYRNAYFAPRSPHVVAVFKQYLYVDSYPGGTTHGTHYDYDRHVPIIFLGAGIKPGTYKNLCGPEDIAPTLAAILKLKFPKEDDARLLLEMMKKSDE